MMLVLYHNNLLYVVYEALTVSERRQIEYIIARNNREIAIKERLRENNLSRAINLFAALRWHS